MVSFASLGGVALVALALAIVVGWRRDLTRKQASGDAAAALLGTLAALTLAVACYGIPWRGPGSWALLASPLTATVALRARGRRSAPRALIASGVVLALVILWLTLNLRGPAGGWTPGQVVLTTSTSAVAIASAACLGWWSKRARDRRPRPRVAR